MRIARPLLLALLLAVIAGSGALYAADQSQLILLNAGAIDLRKMTALDAHGPAAESFTGKHLHLVQFNDAVRPEWYDALIGTGVEVVSYVPNSAYLVYGDATALKQVAKLAASSRFVRGEGKYLDEYKLAPVLRPAVTAMQKKPPPNDLYGIQLVRDPSANAATLQVINSLKLEGIKSQFRLLRFLNVIVRLP